MLMQRKIHHLLASEGEDDTFRYLPRLRAPFDLSQPLLVTEKVDGSTMQAFRGKPWKRFDRFKKGDQRKRLVPEEERYELRPCDPADSNIKWCLKSFEAYKEQFTLFGETYPEHWVYFEALGSKIASRYKNLEPTVRVFDIGTNSHFLPFEEALNMVAKAGLPTVATRWQYFSNLEILLIFLSQDVSRDTALPDHQLEGWVLRQAVNGGEVVAKIRVNNLKKIA